MGGLRIQLGAAPPSPLSLAVQRRTLAVVGRDVSIGGPISGLEWGGNEATPFKRRMLYWPTPFAAYGGSLNAAGTAGGAGATYVMRAFPKGPKAAGVGGAVPDSLYWTAFFHCNNGAFVWGTGYESSYYGAHPYPFNVANGHSFTGQAPEISVDASDFPPSAPDDRDLGASGAAGWNRWYTQVFRCWQPTSTSRVHEFYWDWPDTSRVITRTSSTGYVTPPTPIICMGHGPSIATDLSWGNYLGYEEYKGILRGLQFYSGLLSLTDITAEVASPQSSSNGNSLIWFLNLNPTVADTTDKKVGGSAHNPTWDGADRPADWTG